MGVAWIGLGANLGDRERTLREAFGALARLPGVRAARMSAPIETAPLGPPQPAYLNACARLDLEGTDPLRLLASLQAVEASFGRVRGERWGPRTLDLDLLLFDDRVLEAPGLALPHPRMHERAFVLEPLAELDPSLRHPVLGKTVVELLEAVRG